MHIWTRVLIFSVHVRTVHNYVRCSDFDISLCCLGHNFRVTDTWCDFCCSSRSSRKFPTKAWTVSAELCRSAWWLEVWRCWSWSRSASWLYVAIATDKRVWQWKLTETRQPAPRSVTLLICRWRAMKTQPTSTLRRLAPPLHESLVNNFWPAVYFNLFPPV